MSSIEIIILCVTGAIACITYIVKHFKKSECWTSESCCICKMDKDNKSKSDVVINTSTPCPSIASIDEKEDLKITVSSVV